MRSLKVLKAVNQKAGFDCPGCAWPEPERAGIAEFCENGARAVADEATTHRADPAFFAQHSVEALQARPDIWLNAQGRLTHPMLLEDGASHYRSVSWQEAFDVMGEELRATATPDEAIFYTSGRTSNEAAFLYQLFVRHFGTNNLPDCSNMCHESSGRGLGEVIGTGKGTVSLEDFAHADAIFVIGQNPGTNHPRMLSCLREAKLRGATIVAINPLKEAGLQRFQHPQKPLDLLGGVALADHYLQVRGGGDIALLKAMMKVIIEHDAVDRAFIERHTVGVQALLGDLASHTMADLVDECGVGEASIRTVAQVAIASQATICCWAMGLTQHAHGVGNIQEVVNFLLLRGMLGKPGAGACPVRGHSNVQGDRTMGICERPPAWAAGLGERFGFEAPTSHGYDTVGALQAMHAGKARVFFAMGGNFLSATPDTERTAEALRRCQLTVHVSTKLNRSHLVTGKRALILPCLGRTEADPAGFVTVEDSMSAVHASRGGLEPASDALYSEAAIVSGLALATLGEATQVDWAALAADYSKIRELIEATVPGFENFNERAAKPAGFTLRNSARELDFSALGGKAKFTVVARPRIQLGDGQLLLNTLRAHDQFNTTVYGNDDRYRGVYGHRHVLLANPEDLRARGLSAGDRVSITSHFRGETRTASGFTVLSYDLPRGCAAAYFPEANSLVHTDDFADKSRTPASKSVVITLAPEATA
jgi:molybdopterin-dependent oxidoreductase alpha subunit